MRVLFVCQKNPLWTTICIIFFAKDKKVYVIQRFSDGRNNNNPTIANNNTNLNGQGNDLSGTTATTRKSMDVSGTR